MHHTEAAIPFPSLVCTVLPLGRPVFDLQLCLTVTARQLKDDHALTVHSLAALRALQAMVPHDVARVATMATLHCTGLAATCTAEGTRSSATRTLTALALAYGVDHALVAAFKKKFSPHLAAT
jgi:hypothetical protein